LRIRRIVLLEIRILHCGVFYLVDILFLTMLKKNMRVFMLRIFMLLDKTIGYTES
jgi:hypothetical protein